MRAWDGLYGATSQPVWGRSPIGYLEEFLGYAAPRLRATSRLLDAGGGEGRNVLALERTGAQVSVCDASLQGLRKLGSIAHRRVPCVQCNLLSLPYRSGSFDLVLMADVVETLADPEPSLEEASRVLRRGGMLLCNIPDSTDPVADVDMLQDGRERGVRLYRATYFYRFFDVGTAAEMIRRHGFEIERTEQRAWTEEAHPSFRSYSHQHISNVFLAVRA
jgi:SAM-dependent methyltransferase